MYRKILLQLVTKYERGKRLYIATSYSNIRRLTENKTTILLVKLKKMY